MKAIDWHKWSAVAEILSAIVILVTLLYLALQTRYLAIQTEQNAQAIRAASTQSVVASEISALRAVVEYPDIYASITSDDFTGDDALRLNAFLAIFVRAHENYWRQYQYDSIDEATLQTYQSSLLYLLSYERTRNWWERLKFAFDPEFADRIDSMLEGVELVPGDMRENIRQSFDSTQ